MNSPKDEIPAVMCLSFRTALFIRRMDPLDPHPQTGSVGDWDPIHSRRS